jgi:hypothetical protein
MARATSLRAAFFLLALAASLDWTGTVAATPFNRGDVNQDGKVDLSDPIGVLMYLFLGTGGPIECLDAADFNDSGEVDISDAVHGLFCLFTGGAVCPFRECMEDPTPDELSCERFSNGWCPPTPSPSGSLVKSSACKLGEEGAGASTDEECLLYQYDGASTLTVQHVNAPFNCCPVMGVEVTFEGDQITIVESETFDEGPCRCLCLFDLEIQIRDLPPGVYAIKVLDVYGKVDGPSLEIVADLISGTSGEHCEPRTEYPWGP